MTYATKCAVVNQEVSKLIVDENLTSYQDVQKLDVLNYVRTGNGGSLEVNFGFHVYCVGLSQVPTQRATHQDSVASLYLLLSLHFVHFSPSFSMFWRFDKKILSNCRNQNNNNTDFSRKIFVDFWQFTKKNCRFCD